MPKSAVHLTFYFFMITVLTGVLMRYMLLSPGSAMLNFSHVLHGHSHVAILGWTFLGVFIIFLKLIWPELQAKRQAKGILLATLIITTLMFIAFLIQGYAVFSIIFSTLHICIEYWVIIFMYKQLKQHPAIPLSSKLFFKGALISLFISTIGPFALGGLAMTGLKETPFFDMAIYFYLHFQYNGWLFLMLFGLCLFILHKKGIQLKQSFINKGFWIYMISLFPAYILSVLWFGLGTAGQVFGIIGAVGQFIGIIFIIAAFKRESTSLKNVYSYHIRISLLFIFILLLAKSLMEFGLLYTPFANLIFETRSIVIGYLHLTLLGFISIFILTQYQMVGFLNESRKSVLNGMAVFIIGFMLNEAVLFITGLAEWLKLKMIFQNELLLIASVILCAGIIMIWSSLIISAVIDKRTNEMKAYSR